MPFLDSSVLLASLDPDEPHHAACDRLLAAGGHHACSHALLETFSVLTGGRLGRRLTPALATRLIEDSLLPYVQWHALTPKDTLTVLRACAARGVRGGAVYDWLHLAAARKLGAEVFCTLNLRDFQALALPGDPLLQVPA